MPAGWRKGRDLDLSDAAEPAGSYTTKVDIARPTGDRLRPISGRQRVHTDGDAAGRTFVALNTHGAPTAAF
jgi:hypothetical protein